MTALMTAGCKKTAEEITPIQIMPLGNSITQADSFHTSYRYPLWKMLKESGSKVDFTGSQTNNYMGNNPAMDFDHDHEGHWGWRADQFVNGVFGQGGLTDFLQGNTPDIVLMHLGSNDIFRGESTEQIIEDLKKIIAILEDNNPYVIILIAQLIPVANENINRQIVSLNHAIAQLPSELINVPQLIVVNQYEGFDAYKDTYDGAHPNRKGEEKMARTWFNAVQETVKLVQMGSNL
jgi:hypothetical protein